MRRILLAAAVMGAAGLVVPIGSGAPVPPKDPAKDPRKVAASAPATPAAPTASTTAGTTKPALGQPLSRIKLKFDDTETQLAALLAAPAIGTERDARAVAAQVSYRMIVRHLYEVALDAKTDDLRALAALKADTLANGAAAFDKLVSDTPKWQAAADAPATGEEQKKVKTRAQGALAALAAFEKSAAKANTDMETASILRKYMGDMLGALGPLTREDLGDAKLPVVWPEREAKGPAPVNPDELPTVDATMARAQQSNIMPSLRNELQAILPQLHEGMAIPERAQESVEHYRLMLDCLSLGEQLGASTVLSAKAQAELSQQLLAGLALFKDARTRDSGRTRLAGVGNVASILSHLEKSPLPPAQQQAVGAAMHASVLKLTSAVSAQAARDRLGSLDRLVKTYDRYVKVKEQDTLPEAKEGWTDTKKAGDKLVKDTLDGLAANPDMDMDENVRQLGVLVENCQRLSAMPALIKTAEQYKPKPEDGVARRLIVIARGITATPATAGVSAAEFDGMQQAFATLASIHAAFPTETPDALMNKLSGDRYRQFIAKFLDSEQKLLTALATPNAAFAPLVWQVESEYALLRSVQDMLILENGGAGGGNALSRLNRWGGWQVDEAACQRLVKLFEQALAAEFVAATTRAGAPIPAAPNPPPPPLLSYAASKTAIRNLADIVRRVEPGLAGETTWTASYLEASQWPNNQTILGGVTERLAVAEWLLNEAACNEDNGLTWQAQPMILKAVEVLGGLNVAAER